MKVDGSLARRDRGGGEIRRGGGPPRRHPSCGGKKRINIENAWGIVSRDKTLPNSNRHPEMIGKMAH